jgi:hypothetical protein
MNSKHTSRHDLPSAQVTSFLNKTVEDRLTESEVAILYSHMTLILGLWWNIISVFGQMEGYCVSTKGPGSNLFGHHICTRLSKQMENEEDLNETALCSVSFGCLRCCCV